MLNGLGAMVWQLREWQDGNAVRQALQARELGLGWVSIKITDGFRTVWEEPKQTSNRDLLPDTIAALREAGIQVAAWGWLWGRKSLWDYDRKFWRRNTPALEAAAAMQVCQQHSIEHFQVNAEHPYYGKPGWATEYCQALTAGGIEQSLCSYRWPLTAQPQFPVHQFAPYMEAWSPQVYFLGDMRPHGGAVQLEVSYRQYEDRIRALPFIPIAPTYEYKKLRWRATAEQLRQFLQKAKDLDCPGAGVWDLPQASDEQLQALAGFEWEPPVSPTPAVPERLLAVASTIQAEAAVLHNAAKTLEGIAADIVEGQT